MVGEWFVKGPQKVSGIGRFVVQLLKCANLATVNHLNPSTTYGPDDAMHLMT